MYLRTLFSESVHKSQQSARGKKTQEKVKNSDSLFFFFLQFLSENVSLLILFLEDFFFLDIKL